MRSKNDEMLAIVISPLVTFSLSFLQMFQMGSFIFYLFSHKYTSFTAGLKKVNHNLFLELTRSCNFFLASIIKSVCVYWANLYTLHVVKQILSDD